MPLRASPGRQALLWVGGLTLLGLLHALAVAPHYHLGSFDDDASYVLVAKALASGVGLTGNLSAGYPLVAAYPPGFAALLVPIAWLAPGLHQLYRLLPLIFFVAIFPLTWVWLERRRVELSTRALVLCLLALNPVLGTFATMVMPETAFVVLLLLLFLVAERWVVDPRLLSGAGMGTVLLLSGLLWLKEAALGVIIGLACWLLFRRAWRKAALALVAPGLLLTPVLIARAVVGTPLIGSRYSNDLGMATGGLVHRLVHVVPHSVTTMVVSALPLSVVPTGVSPLPTHGVVGFVLDLVDWTLPPLVAFGLVCWVRRYRDLAAFAVIAYLLETLAYPFMNERRFVLVLPIVVVWYVLGVKQLMGWLALLRDRSSTSRRVSRLGNVVAASRLLGPLAAVALVGAPLVAQFPRDYLLNIDQSTSAPDRSPYMALLRHLGNPRDAVETTYLWTTALFTGHRTAVGAYRAPCDDASVRQAIAADRAGYLLDAALNRPGELESDCLLQVANAASWAVPLLRTNHDDASVFELIGPGTAYPDRVDLVAGPPVIVGNQLSWTWPHPVSVRQVTLDFAALKSHQAVSVVIEVRELDGKWTTVASSAGPIGDGFPRPFLAVELPAALRATAVRVSAVGEPPAVQDFHVLGSNSM